MAGNDRPVQLYTIDVDPDQVPLDEKIGHNSLKHMKMERVRQRIKRNAMREAAFKNEIQVSDSFKDLDEIAVMRKPFGEEWYKTYNSGF